MIPAACNSSNFARPYLWQPAYNRMVFSRSFLQHIHAYRVPQLQVRVRHTAAHIPPRHRCRRQYVPHYFSFWPTLSFLAEPFRVLLNQCRSCPLVLFFVGLEHSTTV